MENILLKFANTLSGKEYFGVPLESEIVMITKNSIHFFTGKFTEEGKPIFCVQSTPGGYEMKQKLKLLNIFPEIIKMAMIGLKYPVPLLVGADTGFTAPTATGGYFNNWTNPTNAYASDNSYATKVGDGATNIKQSYETFGFSIPAGSTINGIEVQVEGSGNSASYNMLEAVRNVSTLSGFTTQLHFTTHDAGSGVDKTVSTGGAADLWDTTWAVSDFSDANFSVWVATDTNGNIASVDQIMVKVYYTPLAGTFISKIRIM